MPSSASLLAFLAMIDNVLERLTTLFTEGGAHFRVIHHPAAGQSSQSVAEIRGTELGQGAKALCCTVKGNGVKKHVLGVLPADMQAVSIIISTDDFKRIVAPKVADFLRAPAEKQNQ